MLKTHFVVLQIHRYMRPFKDFQGGYFPVEVPLHAADVKLVDPTTGYVLRIEEDVLYVLKNIRI